MKDAALWRDLCWALPLGLGLGALLSFAQPGQWWIGWLAFAFVTLIGLLTLAAVWRSTKGGRILAIIIALALGLRLLAGVGLTLGLPAWGYDEPQQIAGYVFYDSYRRDAQAWELAQSLQPLWAAFDKRFVTDQYGGLLALSAAVYRYLSPDAHRPLLIILLGALVAALGVPLLWRVAQRVWGASIAWPATWIFTLYPESILLGSAQMREPFLITFTALILWGFVDWQYNRQHRAWFWLMLGLLGVLLISPGIILILLLILAGWYWFRQALSWRVVGISAGVFFFAVILFSWGVTKNFSLGGLNLKALFDWFILAAQWDIYLLQNQSGWIDKIFSELPASLRLPFVLGYGMLQPVLPAALIEPTLPIWRVIAILRSVGWYVLLPLLIYGWLSAFKQQEKQMRAIWLWLGLAIWTWVAIAALRAGGDQWDNPRYRTILLAISALVAAQGWVCRRDRWFVRIAAVEGISVAFFAEWYLSRYVVDIPKLPFFVMLALIAGVSAIILLGGWLYDYRSSKHA